MAKSLKLMLILLVVGVVLGQLAGCGRTSDAGEECASPSPGGG